MSRSEVVACIISGSPGLGQVYSIYGVQKYVNRLYNDFISHYVWKRPSSYPVKGSLKEAKQSIYSMPLSMGYRKHKCSLIRASTTEYSAR